MNGWLYKWHIFTCNQAFSSVSKCPRRDSRLNPRLTEINLVRRDTPFSERCNNAGC